MYSVNTPENSSNDTGLPREPAVPMGLGGAGSREPWHVSPSPSGESSEPASASLTAHSQANAPPLPGFPREPPGQAQLPPGFTRVQPTVCFAFIGEDTGH